MQKKNKSSVKDSQVQQNFLNLLFFNVTHLESNFDLTNVNYLCALKPITLNKWVDSSWHLGVFINHRHFRCL